MTLNRSGPLRRSPMKPRTAPVRKAQRDTGPSRKTRAKVRARFDGSCAGCGRFLGPGVPASCQHIVARGVGGDNDLTLLVDLCGTATFPPDWCHPRCERREAGMRDRGLWRRSSDDPRPLELWDGRVVWLTADGGYVLEGAS